MSALDEIATQHLGAERGGSFAYSLHHSFEGVAGDLARHSRR